MPSPRTPSPRTLLLIGHVWPEPRSSAAGTRTLGLLRLFSEQGWQVHFACDAAPTEHSSELPTDAVKGHAIRLNHDSFDDFIRSLKPDLVIFDRFMTEEQYGWRVAEHCPLAMRVLDTIDLHYLRHARHVALKQNRIMSRDDLQSDIAKREIASILRCDLSLLVSDFEYELLLREFRIDASLLHTLPLLVDKPTPTDITQLPAFAARQGFVFIGNFLHEPNADAVRHLHAEIWPALRRRLPHADLRIYGAYTPEWARQMHKPKAGFHVLDRAEHAQVVLQQARIVLAPLRFGAGVKGKLIDAMVAGTPSITTAIGAEGLGDADIDWPGNLAATPEETIEAASALYENQQAWDSAQARGFALIEKRHADPVLGEGFLKTITRLMTDLAEHRRHHFLGSLLHHHTVQSLRFKSKWIALKNASENAQT